MNAYSMTLRVWHPSRDAVQIAEGLRLTPTFRQSAGMPRVPGAGQPLPGRYRETCCCFYLAPAPSLAASLDAVTGLLRRHAADLGQWRQEGGRVNVALDASRGDHVPLVVGASVLAALGALGVGIEARDAIGRRRPRRRSRALGVSPSSLPVLCPTAPGPNLCGRSRSGARRRSHALPSARSCG